MIVIPETARPLSRTTTPLPDGSQLCAMFPHRLARMTYFIEAPVPDQR